MCSINTTKSDIIIIIKVSNPFLGNMLLTILFCYYKPLLINEDYFYMVML